MVCFVRMSVRLSATSTGVPSRSTVFADPWASAHVTPQAARSRSTIPGRVVFEHGECPLEPSDVLGSGIDEQVDVLRGALAAVQDDGEAADQDVAGPGLFEGAADASDVFDGWRADLWDIWILSHAWASSKLVNRNRPRGASPRVPRRAHAVRRSASALRAVAAPSRRLPTTLEGSTSISRSRLTKASLYPDAGPVQCRHQSRRSRGVPVAAASLARR